MSLIHPWMGWLALLAVVPIILHWLMRPQPKKHIFPALRLVELRKKQNTRRLRMRHLSLLLLRIGVVLGIVFALARPRVPSSGYLPTNMEWGILTGVVLSAVAVNSLLSRSRSRNGSRVKSMEEEARKKSRQLMLVSSGAFLLIFIFVVWPLQARIRSEDRTTSPPLDGSIPVAAACVFDSSLSMDYKHQGKTRLESAQEIAVNHINTLPRGSQISFTDTSASGEARFSPDLSTVSTRIGRLETRAVSHALDEKLLAAIDSHLSSIGKGSEGLPAEERTDDFIREIYLFTDLTLGGWTEQRTNRLAEKLKGAEQIGLYIIDVGSESAIDNSLNDLKLSDSAVPPGGEVRLAVRVGTTSKTPVEIPLSLYLQSAEAGGELVKQEQISVQASASSPGSAEFLIKNLQGTVCQGEVRLGSSDPLPFDDIQQFTIEIQPQIKVLVVSDTRREAEFWMNALSPEAIQAPQALQGRGGNSIICDWRGTKSLRSKPIGEYSTIALINAKSPTDEDWKELHGYVEGGGGLAVILGKEVDSASYFTPKSAMELLPGELFGHATFDPPQILDLAPGKTHPILKKFSELQITTIANSEVRRYWRVKPVADSRTLIRYGDDKLTPALLERNVGKGRVLLLTTGVSRQGWNELPVSGWYFVALADQLTRYLSQHRVGEVNYFAGDSILLTLPESTAEQSFLLRKPSGQQMPMHATSEQSTLFLNDLDQLGSYRLLSSVRESSFEKGFSINYSPRESDPGRISETELAARLGKDRYRIVRSLEDLERTVRTGRIGVEAFPEFFAFLVLFFMLELALSNLFYRDEGSQAAPPSQATSAA